MTEDAWRTTTRGALAMCKFARPRLSPRRLQLLMAAAFRHLLPAALSEGSVEDLVEAIESHADRRCDGSQFAVVRDRAMAIAGRHPMHGYAVHLLADLYVADAVCTLVGWITGRYLLPQAFPGPPPDLQPLCDIIREIAGNPFRPWKAIPEAMGGGLVQPDGATVRVTDAARAVAEGIAADQGFDRLPVLADALEDGGVTDAELLAHCRRPGGHLRGCWAVDVVLGRG